MNKYKEMYKESIVKDIIGKIVDLDDSICACQGCREQVVLDQQWGTIRYMKNLIKTITAESDSEVEERITEYRQDLLEIAKEKMINEE